MRVIRRAKAQQRDDEFLELLDSMIISEMAIVKGSDMHGDLLDWSNKARRRIDELLDMRLEYLSV